MPVIDEIISFPAVYFDLPSMVGSRTSAEGSADLDWSAFTAGIYPILMCFSREPALAMMLSLYVTLGILLLLAARNPSANRSLIAFAAWSSLAHPGVRGFRV